jgi:hypothetical protein
VTRFFVAYLCGCRNTMFANFKNFPRYPPEMVIPGYGLLREDAAMQSACPGNHKKWAGALMGLYFSTQNERMRRELDITRMTATLAEFNQTIKGHSGRLAVRYFNTLVSTTADSGKAYKELLLGRTWHTMTAAKQASGSWRNASWEMFNHRAKLVACPGYQPQSIPAPQMFSPTELDPFHDLRDGRRPPPFIDPQDIQTSSAPQEIVDRKRL